MGRIAGIAVVVVCALSAGAPAAIAAQTGSLELSPGTFAYPRVVVGASHGATFLVTNHGTQRTPALADSLSGSAEFAVVKDGCLGKALPAAGQCQIKVNFAPSAGGAAAATLTVAAGGTAVSADLSGRGTVAAELALDPPSVDFGTVAGGTTSAPHTLTLSNTGGQTAKSVSAGITGANAGEFAVSSTTCGSTIKAGAACTIDVTFTPPAGSGPASATLSVTSAQGSAAAALTGSGPCLVHQNGYGATYLSCQPLGTPGSPATYTQTMAAQAAHAYDSSATITTATCPSGAVVEITSGGNAIVWQYTGTLAGYTERTAGSSGACPTTGSRTWN